MPRSVTVMWRCSTAGAVQDPRRAPGVCATAVSGCSRRPAPGEEITRPIESDICGVAVIASDRASTMGWCSNLVPGGPPAGARRAGACARDLHVGREPGRGPVWEDGGMAVAPVRESGPIDAPPPISPSTSVLSLLLAIAGACLVGLALLGGVYATVSHTTNNTATRTAVSAPTAVAPTNPPATTGTTGAASGVRPLSDVVLSATP